METAILNIKQGIDIDGLPGTATYVRHKHIGSEYSYGGCHVDGYHVHIGNQNTQGGCYTVGTHIHEGEEGVQGGCYTVGRHKHNSSCAVEHNAVIGQKRCGNTSFYETTPSQGADGVWHSEWRCSKCDAGYPSAPNSCTAMKDIRGDKYKCGSPKNYWDLGCDNMPINNWDLGCNNSPINRWGLGCGLVDNQIIGVDIVY